MRDALDRLRRFGKSWDTLFRGLSEGDRERLDRELTDCWDCISELVEKEVGPLLSHLEALAERVSASTPPPKRPARLRGMTSTGFSAAPPDRAETREAPGVKARQALENIVRVVEQFTWRPRPSDAAKPGDRPG